MAFWGIEVKPQNPYTHLSKTSKGRLHVSQATLGTGSGTNKTMVQCNVGDKYPVFLCALLPGISESCSLDLEFDERQDVIFSVIGPRTVHLTGYYLPSHPQFGGDDESESYGEDIARSENEESDHCSDDYNYDDSFINDGDMSYYSDDNEEEDSVINKPVKKKDRKRLKKKHQPDEPVGIVVHVPQQIKHVHRRSRALTVPSDDDDDDEDNREASNDNGSLPSDQRNIKCGDLKPASSDEADYKEGPETKKLKTDQHKVEVKKGNVHTKIEKADNESNPHSELQLQSETGKDIDGVDVRVRPLLGESEEAPPDEITGRILSGGLIVEDLAEGKAEGKVACRGKKVKIKFVGKLQSGKVIESNTYETLHKFRLGAGNVIEGLNIGIEGMKIGGKRRLTIPPSLGYGSEGIEEKIPPDSWLIYEIELISTP